MVRILELSGESQPQATADAQIVLKLETALANVAMDIAARRDPKNQNNKMSLQQLASTDALVQLESLFHRYARARLSGIPVVAPDLFRSLEKLAST